MSRKSYRQITFLLPFLLTSVGLSLVIITEAAYSPLDRLIESFNDDAFYYFEVAKNMAAGLGSTFDRISMTNGYHPLWLVTLVPVYLFDLDIYSSLVFIKAISAAAWTLSIGTYYLIAKMSSQQIPFALTLVPLIYASSLWFSGMESTISLPLLLVVIYLVVSRNLFSEAASTFWSTVCGFVMALAVLARLDLVFLVAVVGGFVLLGPNQASLSDRLRKIICLTLPSVIVLTIYMVINQTIFDIASPVSGMAKSIGAPFLNLRVFGEYFDFRPIPAPLLRNLNVLFYLVFVLVPALLLLRYKNRGSTKVLVRWNAETTQTLEKLLYILLLSNFIQLSYFAVNSSWSLWRWYYYYFPLLMMMGVPVVLSFLIDIIRIRGKLTMTVLLGLSCLLLIKLDRSYTFSQKLAEDRLANYKTHSVQVAKHLNETLGTDSVFAMGDRAGSLGYQLNGSLVQTEGLVGSIEYLRALEAGTVHSLLREFGVQYFVYSGGAESGGDPLPITVDELEGVCFSVTVPKYGSGPRFETVVCDRDMIYQALLTDSGPMGGSYTVWRYRPELNPDSRLAGE